MHFWLFQIRMPPLLPLKGQEALIADFAQRLDGVNERDVALTDKDITDFPVLHDGVLQVSCNDSLTEIVDRLLGSLTCTDGVMDIPNATCILSGNFRQDGSDIFCLDKGIVGLQSHRHAQRLCELSQKLQPFCDDGKVSRLVHPLRDIASENPDDWAMQSRSQFRVGFRFVKLLLPFVFRNAEPCRRTERHNLQASVVEAPPSCLTVFRGQSWMLWQKHLVLQTPQLHALIAPSDGVADDFLKRPFWAP
jgi:hypothetical protein